ncbi:MAG: hypothetical protein JXR96_17840 [Deltaproteobacteria bacterium]|nr:hypothetical protein [Deltaproteobacteria bacterium]
MRRAFSLSVLLALACGSGCGQGPYSLQIHFPDDAARQRAVRVRVVVVEADAEASCSALLALEARPGDPGYAIDDEIVFDYPPAGEIPELSDLDSGPRLFYAEAEDEDQRVFVNGCVYLEAAGAVDIQLDYLSCEPTNNGVEICDGLDNDCDELTDEGDPDAICEPRAHATATDCDQGQCTYDCDPGWFDANSDTADGCECRPTRGGEEWCDGLDNDCDGQVDGAGCIQCSGNADCEDANSCLTGTCQGGICSPETLADGSTCDDGDACSLDDQCQDGICAGRPNDCADELDCTQDACSPADGTCSHELMPGYCLVDGVCAADGGTELGNSCRRCDVSVAADAWQTEPAGTSCDDGLWCTGEDESCDAAGNCIHNDPPCTAVCMGACDEQTHGCGFDPDGTECDDGFSCTEDDACDGAGACLGTAIDGYCGVDQECQPECASDALGCVERPNYILLDCPEGVPADQAASCSVTLNGGEGTEGCIHCRVQLIPSVLVDDEFYGPGECFEVLGNWSVEPHGCGADPNRWCPFTSGGETQACCEPPTIACNASDRGIELRFDQCQLGGWRLSQFFHFGTFEAVRTCYGVLQRPGGLGGALEILYDPGNELDGTLVSCDEPGFWAEDYHTHACVDLPGAVTDMPQTRLTYWAEVGDDFDPANLLGLGSIAVYAFPPECHQEASPVEELFDACGHDIDTHNGWEFSPPATCAELQQHCGRQGGLLLGNVDGHSITELGASLDLDLRGLVGPGQLCWNHYRSVNFNGSYRVAFYSNQGAAWYVPVYDSQFQQFVPADECREICVDLKGAYYGVIGQTGFSVSFTGDATTGGYLLISDVRLSASQACDATGVLEVGPVGEGQVEITSTQGLPRRARLECSWGDGTVYTRREVEFYDSSF